MPEDDNEAHLDSMLNAALGGLTPHQALLRASLAEAADSEGKAAAIARNRERALKLLAALEKKQD